MTRGRLIWMRAETFIHVGVGQQPSLVDLPFAREGATGYPYIPGSGMKGALRDALWIARDCPTNRDACTAEEFGSQEEAGKVLVSDARLAFLPIRTLAGAYRYVTSPSILERIARDMDFVGRTWRVKLDPLQDDEARGSAGNGRVFFLEEFKFTEVSLPLTLKPLPGMPAPVKAEVDKRLAVIADEAFDFFARHGLFVRQRNKLDPDTKTVDGGALWSEESLPPDTLMYVVLVPRIPTAHRETLETVADKLIHGRYVQVGGNETVGEGWFELLRPEPVETKVQGAAHAQ